MTLSGVLNSDQGLALVGTLVGGLWTFFKSTEWYARARQRRYDRAVQALEAGIEETYRTYVRAIKTARTDGALTEEEVSHAHRLALDSAVAYGRKEGVDVIHELGNDYLDLWISKLVNRMKRD